ncbi:MAG TPA: phytanoyl-CoA dioxygenase family protein [Nitriliruptorales bacterium]
MERVLTDEQIESWRTDGFVLVEGFLDATEVKQAREDALLHFPSREDFDAAPPEERPKLTSGMGFEMLPYKGDGLNLTAFHPKVTAAAEQLLGTADLRLVQSILRVTYGGPDTADQPLHRDFHDNTLLPPASADTGFGHLPVLIYYTDVDEGTSPTFVVRNRDGGDRPLVPFYRQREDDPELYDHERPNLVTAGTVMFYSMDTFHRGSAATDPEGYRLAHHLVLRPAGCDWMSFTAWPPLFDTEHGRRCIEQLTPRQRELLGIPAPGHPYWTEQTIDGFVARYPNADPEPYRAEVPR